MLKSCVLAICIATVMSSPIQEERRVKRSMGMPDLGKGSFTDLGSKFGMGGPSIGGGAGGGNGTGNFTLGGQIDSANIDSFAQLFGGNDTLAGLGINVPANGTIDNGTLARLNRLQGDMSGFIDAVSNFNMSAMFDTIENNPDFKGILGGMLPPDQASAFRRLAGAKDMIDFSDFGSMDDLMDFMDETADLDDDMFQSFDLLENAPENVTADMLYNIPVSMYSMMKPQTMKRMFGNFSADQQDNFCQTIAENADSATSDAVLGQVNCLGAFGRLGDMGFELSDEMQAAVVGGQFSGRTAAQYTDADWDLAISNDLMGAFDPDQMSALPSSVLRNNIGKFASQMGTMDIDARESFFDEMGDAFNFDQLDGAALGNMAGMLNDMPFEDLEKIPASAKLAALGSLGGIQFDDEAAMDFYEDITDSLDLSSWTPDQFDNAFEFIAQDADMMDALPFSVVAGNLDKIGAKFMDEEEALAMGERLLKEPMYQDATAWNSSTIGKIGNLLAGMPRTFIDDLPASAVADAIMNMNLSNADMSFASSRSMVSKIVSQSGGGSRRKRSAANINGTMLMKMGRMVQGLTTDMLDQIPAGEFMDGMASFKSAYEDMQPSQRSAVMDKVTAAIPTLGVGILANVGPFMQDMSAKAATELSLSDLNITDSRIKSPPKLNISHATARVMFEKVKAEQGSMSSSNGNYTIKLYKNLGMVVCGMSCDDIKTLPLNKIFPSMTKVLTNQRDMCWDDVQLRCMAGRVREYIWNNATTASVKGKLNRDMVKQFARFLPFFNLTDLESFGKGRCQDVVTSIGKFPLNNVPRNDLVALKNFSLTCMNKTTGMSISDKDVRAGGDLVCGMEASDVPRLARAIFKNRMKRISQRCALPADVGQAILLRSLTQLHIEPRNMTAKSMVKLGPLMAYMDTAQVDQLNMTELRKAAPRVKNAVQKFKDQLQKKIDVGMAAEDPTMTAGLNNVFTKVATAYVNKRSGSSSRRKRTTYSSLTCSDLKSMGTGVTSLTTAQLNLATAEFTNCVDYLGAQSGFSSAQKSALTDVAKRVWGSTVSSWTAANIALSGVIAQGLSTSEIDTLALSTRDAVNGIAKYTGWTSAQVTSGAARYITSAKSGNAATLDSADLKSMSNFVCGLTTAQIGALSATIYAGAALEIGQLSGCAQNVLTAWAAHAKTTYGSTVSSWTSSTMATVGSVMGGLTTSDIQSLSSSQLQAVSATTISNLPTSTFAALSTSQLSGLSTAQASVVTDAQKASLSTEALAIINNNAATVVVATTTTAAPQGGSGAGNMHISAVLAGVMLLTARLFTL